MSIATVVLRGYGTASYADAGKLPTLGYSSGAAPTTTIYGPARVMRSSVSVVGPRAANVAVDGARVGAVQ
jgi:hypothetical protein